MQRPLSIYVHYPYCSQICTFCAFNKYRLPRALEDEHTRLLHAYQVELRHGLRYLLSQHRHVSSAREIRSVYFGGGTPSLFARIVPELLSTIRSEYGAYRLSDDAEITIEANPSSLPPVQDLTNSGVTRISLGVQSLTNSKRLKAFGREHDAQGAIAALDRLVADRHLLPQGFTFDLMFGNPNDRRTEPMTVSARLAEWRSELHRALPYAQIGGHLSLYELTLEHGTPLAREVKAGKLSMPSSDSNADEYELAASTMTAAGFDHYEVSSFAAQGRQSRHNMAFWMGEDLLGIGPGAHGRLRSAICANELEASTAVRTRNIREPRRWAAQVAQSGHGTARIDNLTASELAQEIIAVGLRTSHGVSEANLKGLTRRHMGDELDAEAVTSLIESGLLTQGQSEDAPTVPPEWQQWYKAGTAVLRATARGRSVLDLLTPQILR